MAKAKKTSTAKKGAKEIEEEVVAQEQVNDVLEQEEEVTLEKDPDEILVDENFEGKKEPEFEIDEQNDLDGEVKDADPQEILDEFAKSTDELASKLEESDNVEETLKQELEKAEKTEEKWQEKIKELEKETKGKGNNFAPFSEFWGGISYT